MSELPQDLESTIAYMRGREANVPNAGDTAPDFELERLDADGKRLGEYQRLSALQGRPVALVFGSYT